MGPFRHEAGLSAAARETYANAFAGPRGGARGGRPKGADAKGSGASEPRAKSSRASRPASTGTLVCRTRGWDCEKVKIVNATNANKAWYYLMQIAWMLWQMFQHCRKTPRTRKKHLDASKSRGAAKRSEAASRDFWNI